METLFQSEPCGVLIVRKAPGMTSHDVVNKIRRLYGTRRVGHTGTLDPMATGVLVVLIGRAAKAEEYLSVHGKTYLAGLRLGLTTDTEDITGTVLTRSDNIPDLTAVLSCLKQFRGDILQIPPMYSALKVNGQKLVDLARKGQTVERQPRKITVKKLEVTPTDSPCDYLLQVACSGGTYIRTLCADIGSALGCGGVMTSLERTSVGDFPLSQSYTLEQLEGMQPAERLEILHPIEELFSDCPALNLEPFYEKLIYSGCAVEQKKLRSDFPNGQRLRLCNAKGIFFALGEVSEETVKSVKLFVL